MELAAEIAARLRGFSALQRAEIAEIGSASSIPRSNFAVSVLFNEPKLLKFASRRRASAAAAVSVLFNEPKLLKCVFKPRSV